MGRQSRFWNEKTSNRHLCLQRKTCFQRQKYLKAFSFYRERKIVRRISQDRRAAWARLCEGQWDGWAAKSPVEPVGATWTVANWTAEKLVGLLVSGNTRVQVKVVLVIFFVSSFGRAQKVWQNEIVFIEQAALVLESRCANEHRILNIGYHFRFIYAGLVNYRPRCDLFLEWYQSK